MLPISVKDSLYIVVDYGVNSLSQGKKFVNVDQLKQEIYIIERKLIQKWYLTLEITKKIKILESRSLYIIRTEQLIQNTLPRDISALSRSFL